VKLSIKSELVYSFADSTQIIANIEASYTSDQVILSESLDIQPPTKILSGKTPYGDRSIRASLCGQVTVRYLAEVENNVRQLLPLAGRQHVWSDLPIEVLPFLLPSRFCPSDKFMRFAQREFGSAGDGVARVMAMLEWIHRKSTMSRASATPRPQPSGPSSTARACAAISPIWELPSRVRWAFRPGAVSAYALQLNPPDFHAIFEVYLENGWWLIDPTRLAPIEGIVKIGSGRDASDIAFLTSDKQCLVLSQTIAVSKA